MSRIENRRYISISVQTGIQNIEGSKRYVHQSGDIVQTYPDNAQGFEWQTDIQSELFIAIAQLVNEMLVAQKNDVLDLVKTGKFVPQGDDL